MSYQVKFTETTNPSKPNILVQDQTLETTHTSLSFVGKNYAGYARPIAENFLHLLENFANPSEPPHPVQGQLWFDNSPGVNVIKVNVDGQNTWLPVGGVKKSATPPIGNITGDLWVDTAKSQLNLYTGSNWLLVGPQYSEGSRSGPEVELIIDINDQGHAVIVLYCEGYRVSIISSATFIPKSTIPGFAKINQGLTLSTFDFSNTNSTELTKFWGRTSEADALNINGKTISSTFFLRSDITSTTNKSFNVRDDAGISIGSNLNFTISTTNNETILESKTSGKNIKVKVAGNELGSYTAINIDPSGKVGLGIDNFTPLATVDINGNNASPNLGFRTDGAVLISNTTESTNITTGSIVTSGGLGVRLKANFGSNIDVNGIISVGNTNQVAGTVLSPGPINVVDSLVTKIYDIGSSTRSFRNIYADKIYGNVIGNITVTEGLIDGNISGSAGSLRNPTIFGITGEVVSSNTISFNGENGTATFNTTISENYYPNRPAVSSFGTNDVLFLNRPGTGGGFKQISKTNFVNSMPVVPVGTVFPFAGSVPPPGYFFCDGSEVPIGEYIALHNVIGFTYKPSQLLKGRATFALPDLRGRFALGRDNMNNGISVESKDSSPGSPVYITTVTNTAGRVTSEIARTLGGEYPSTATATEQGGTDTRVLKLENLPNHKHSLKSSDGTVYYAMNPGGTVPPPDLGGYVGKVHAIGESAQFIPVTGNIDTTISQLQKSFNIMNPYMTINYIIFHGVLS